MHSFSGLVSENCPNSPYTLKGRSALSDWAGGWAG